jgi:hypothetical protein
MLAEPVLELGAGTLYASPPSVSTALDGPGGVGKSTTIQLLAKALDDRAIPVHTTTEPTHRALGRHICCAPQAHRQRQSGSARPPLVERTEPNIPAARRRDRGLRPSQEFGVSVQFGTRGAPGIAGPR